MCGILGCVGRPEPEVNLREGLRRLIHRGPDAEGLMRSDHPRGEAWMGFRRLAIQDPTERGNQPMTDSSGRWRIVFNGEIYNFRELRAELEPKGYTFRTGTDTEVLLAAWAEWGTESLGRLIGMFAFAILDLESGDLVLARDRLGIKPLYIHDDGGRLSFASEIKAILALSGVERRVDPVSLGRFLTFLWTPSPGSLLDGIHQLDPGSWLRLHGNGRVEHGRFWDLDLEGLLTGGRKRDDPAELEALLTEAVRARLISDVPLGAFLSGGVDSSLIVALMSGLQTDPVSTHTIVFPSADDAWRIEEDDAPWARKVQEYLGDRLDAHTHEIDAGQADLLPKLTWHLDDPVADTAAIATYQICKAAKPLSTVMLAGMGAEELFAGYPRHRAALLAERYRMIPSFLRTGILEPLVDRLPAGKAGPLLAFSRRAKKFTASAGLPFEERYLGFAGYYDPDGLEALYPDPAARFAWGRHADWLGQSQGLDPVTRMTHLDLKTFLPSLNLAYTDRASMAASVEVRVPILDHRVVEHVFALPARAKLRGSTSKVALKAVAERYLPRDVVHRPKAGFQAPVRAWVGRDMKDRISDLLSPDRVRARGWLDPNEVTRLLEAQWSGRDDNALRIWTLVTLEMWARTFLDSDGSAEVSW